MSRLGNQVRRPSPDPREKRNADDFASDVDFVDDAVEVIHLDENGVFTLNLTVDGGLENVSAALKIKLNGTDLTLANDGISISPEFRTEITNQLNRAIAGLDDGSNQLLFAQLAADQAMIASLIYA